VEALHRPVLLAECLDILALPEGPSLMVDGTLGEGGHAEAFLARFPGLKITGVDADAEILERAKKRLEPFGARISFENCLFEEYAERLFAAGGRCVDAVLLDLGISIFHYEASGRGFSFQRDEALDMRIDASRGESAADILARLGEGELADAIYNLGGERYSRRIASAVVEARRKGRIDTAKAFADIVWRAVPPQARKGYLHPATRSFQALRILANDELGRLERGLRAAVALLRAGGKLGVISFHSLEDGIVKRFFKSLSAPIPGSEGAAEFELLAKKPIAAGREECLANKPSRSAKLRALRRRAA
jgi:16S rRNA (cytosine1402-N4)-methyltransferase